MLHDTCSFSPLPLDDWLRRLTYTYQMKVFKRACNISDVNLFQVNNLGYYGRTVQLTTLSLIETIRALPQYASLCKIWKKISTKLFLTNADVQLF